MQTQRTKAKIEENLALLCATLGLDQTSVDIAVQQKILAVYNALRWTADDVEAQCAASSRREPAVWQSQDEQCTEFAWGDWTIMQKVDGWHLLVSSGKWYGPFGNLKAAKQCAEDVRTD